MNLLQNLGCILAFTVMVPTAMAAPLVTPYARQGTLKLDSVSLSSASVPRYERVEISLNLAGTYDNPFDPDDVALDALVGTPSGKGLTVPGFFTRPYRRELDKSKEKLIPAGEAGWRVRFTPMETGAHSIVLRARDRSGEVRSQPLALMVVAPRSPGFVRISPRDPRYFEFDNGSSYFPIGANVCWAYGKGSYNYDDWFLGYATNGGNYARLWLSPHWSTFALERPGKREEGLGLGQFDLGNAWRIDYVLDLAAANGLRLMLCIDSYNILREKDGYPQWDSTPHNQANGGPLARPADFWTSSAMDKLYRDKLRYLVARYGASPAVMSWEFWNEVDITTSYRSAPVKEWHARMASALRALDPHQHLITTSFAGTRGDKEIDTLSGIEYVQTHHYNSPDLAVTVANAQAQKTAYGKPHLVGEIGADSGGPRSKDDPLGLQIHDPQWVSIVTAGAGAAQPWWWDNLIHPHGLYPLFGAVARFTAGIDWPGEHFRVLAPRVEWQSRPNPPQRRDLRLEGGPVSWNPSDANKPRHVQVTQFGASGDLPLAGIQHGVHNHPREHNPVTFEVNLPWPTRFEVQVGDVSGYGGGALQIVRDGEVVVTNVFPVTMGKTGTTQKQYARGYGVDLSPGKHTLIVKNTGADWFMAGYVFRNAVERTSPPLLAWASAGENTVLAWARVEDRTWQRVCARKENVPPCPPSVLVLPGAGRGKWRAELWNTWKGAVIATSEVEADGAGDIRIKLGETEQDVAVKLRRTEDERLKTKD